MAAEFKVGDRVHARGLWESRFGYIAEITTSRSGMTVYILRDGGWFSAKELTHAK